MAQTFATELTGVDSSPSSKSSGAVQGGRLRRFRATIEFDGQAAGDTVVLADVPAGYVFAYGVTTASATAGASATIAIGPASSSGKYRAAAVHTTTAPTLFGVAAATKASPSTAVERVLATIAVAALPASADYMVVDLYFSAP